MLSLAPREKVSCWTNGELKERSKNVGFRSRKDIGRKIRMKLFTMAQNMIEKINKDLEMKDQVTKLLGIPFNGHLN